MSLPRFRLRTLMIAVPVAGVVLALTIEAAGPTSFGSVRQVLLLLHLLSIAWVPAVFLLLSPKWPGWLSVLAASAAIASSASSLYQAANGGPGRESGGSGG